MLQWERFKAKILPPPEEVAAFCVRAREWPGWTIT
jgi:hypothetical protein